MKLRFALRRPKRPTLEYTFENVSFSRISVDHRFRFTALHQFGFRIVFDVAFDGNGC